MSDILNSCSAKQIYLQPHRRLNFYKIRIGVFSTVLVYHSLLYSMPPRLWHSGLGMQHSLWWFSDVYIEASPLPCPQSRSRPFAGMLARMGHLPPRTQRAVEQTIWNLLLACRGGTGCSHRASNAIRRRCGRICAVSQFFAVVPARSVAMSSRRLTHLTAVDLMRPQLSEPNVGHIGTASGSRLKAARNSTSMLPLTTIVTTAPCLSASLSTLADKQRATTVRSSGRFLPSSSSCLRTRLLCFTSASMSSRLDLHPTWALGAEEMSCLGCRLPG